MLKIYSENGLSQSMKRSTLMLSKKQIKIFHSALKRNSKVNNLSLLTTNNFCLTYNLKKAGAGWEAPAVAPWLEIAAENASSKVRLPDSPDSRTNVGQLMYVMIIMVRAQAFGKPACYLGEGGSIPFMGMLLDMFPKAQFLVTGAAGPGSNMHAPNEFLHIDYSARIAMCVAQVVATLATKKAGESAASASSSSSSGDEKAAAAGGVSHRKTSFLQSFKQAGGQPLFFVGCDCGRTGCVIFDQGKEKLCRPTKVAKV